MGSRETVETCSDARGVRTWRWRRAAAAMDSCMCMIRRRWESSGRGEGLRDRYRLPGHRSVVNDVDFHPIEPIICSVSSDHSVLLGEILP